MPEGLSQNMPGQINLGEALPNKYESGLLYWSC